MIRRLALLGAALALLAGCMPETPTDISVKTYQVSGRSMNALERSLRVHGPSVPGLHGRAFAAVETSFLHNFEARQSGPVCRYNRDGRVGLRSEVTLPEWRQRDAASPDLKEKWDLIHSYAIIHEAGHIKISQKYARELEAAYKSVSAPTCQELEAKMKTIIAPIAARHVAEQQEYDRTDGARFEQYIRQFGYTVDS